eukprot:1720087-Pleurochrysis_carterae.AAC.1
MHTRDTPETASAHSTHASATPLSPQMRVASLSFCASIYSLDSIASVLRDAASFHPRLLPNVVPGPGRARLAAARVVPVTRKRHRNVISVFRRNVNCIYRIDDRWETLLQCPSIVVRERQASESEM